MCAFNVKLRDTYVRIYTSTWSYACVKYYLYCMYITHSELYNYDDIYVLTIYCDMYVDT